MVNFQFDNKDFIEFLEYMILELKRNPTGFCNIKIESYNENTEDNRRLWCSPKTGQLLKV